MLLHIIQMNGAVYSSLKLLFQIVWGQRLIAYMMLHRHKGEKQFLM